MLIVDQFEETFTECRAEAERQAFIAALGAAARSTMALVVLGVRADFYGSCLAYPALLTALQGPVAVGPMSAEQLRAAITRPAETEGLGLEPGLVELLLRDLGVAGGAGLGVAGYDPGALPLLAHALRATWQQREGQMLTVAGYRRTGGIGQALATTADHAYARLSPAEQQTARQVLLRLVNISDQGASGDTRRRLPRARLVETGHTHYVNTVAFSPDGRTLASGSADQTIRLWGMNLDQTIQQICATTTNTLTPATWEQYVSKDLPYRPPCP